MKDNFFGCSRQSLKARVQESGLPAYLADQLWRWVYQKLAWEPAQWSNIAKARRVQLSERFSFELPRAVRCLADGQGTSKTVLQLSDGHLIECVSIPETGHVTFCVSSQVGCPLACRFCATGRLGFKRNLAVAEIIAQVLIMKRACSPFSGKLNLVFMGMGEPLLNSDNLFAALDVITASDGLAIPPKSITVSTAGILAGIEKLLERFPTVKLSLSLNGYSVSSRDELMPVGRKEPITAILQRLRCLRSRHRVTFEYVLLPGCNDSPEQARQLAAWLHGIPCKINLIPFNPFPGAPFSRPETAVVDRFATQLHRHGFTVVVRWSKGGEIAAACGQLAGVTNHEQSPV